MDIILGFLVWGGLLVAASCAVVGLYRGSRSTAPVASSRSSPVAPGPAPPVVAPPATTPSRRSVLGETRREGDALVDGLIIGHHLTRTHYEERLEEQAETIDALRAEASAEWYQGDDDTEAEDADDGDGFDGLDPAGDPWEDDIFGFEDFDDDDA